MRGALFVTVMLLSIFRLAGHFHEPRLSDAAIHAITGEPCGVSASSSASPAAAAPVSASASAQDRTLTIVSWNIERGVEFDRILETLHALAPDVVLLQEADRYCRRSGHRDVARDLAQALRMNWISAGEFQEIGEASGEPAIIGQAILSREPITDASVIAFTHQSSWRWRWSPTQPRRGGRIALRARTAGIDIVNLHLESQSNDALRTRQLEEALAPLAAASHAVFAGDFNNAAVSLSTPAGFVDALADTTASRQTSINHQHPIDWIFVKGLTVLPRAARVERIDNVSDHYPLIAPVAMGNLPPRGQVAGFGASR